MSTRSRFSVDWLIIASVTLCVLAEIAINFIDSYGHIYVLGLKYGEYGTDARLTPIGIDLLMLVFAEINLFLARKGRYKVNRRGKRKPEFRWPRWVLGFGVAATVSANGAYGFWWGFTGAAIAMIAAVLLFFTVEGGMLLLRVAAEEAAKSEAKAKAEAAKLDPIEAAFARGGLTIDQGRALKGLIPWDEGFPVERPETLSPAEEIQDTQQWHVASTQAEALQAAEAASEAAAAAEQPGKAAAPAPSINTEAWRGLNGIGLRNRGQ